MVYIVEISTDELFKQISDELPAHANISDKRFEASDIVFYTSSRKFLNESGEVIRNLVSKFKKRIIIRPDISICMDMEDAEKAIKKAIPKEAGLQEIDFEPEFGRVTIEVDRPGLAIGKGGDILKDLKTQISWSPLIKRAPAVPSDVVKTLRDYIYKEGAFRKDFLNKIGKRIHSGWRETKWIRLTGLGAFREVGRSCLLVQTPESRVLLDCGIKPGTDEPPYFDAPEFDVQRLNAIVLSHAHMDHAALVPALYEMGYDGPLYCTAPTRDLMVLLCMDFINVAQKEAKKPFYSSKGIKEAVRHCIPLEWGEVSDITPDIRLTLFNAGHILGSSLCHLHIGNGMHNILYTGDMKFDRTALFDPASFNFTRAETIINESTYGKHDRVQTRRDESESMLIESVKKTLKRGGKVLIPSFAVERAQDLMVILRRGNLGVTIYLDGMVWDATAIHTTYPEYFGRELQKQMLQDDTNPFTDPIFKRVGSMEERKKILESSEPFVVISTSGMMIGGPSVWWAHKLVEDKKNMVIFVGYQAEGTLGKKIQKGYKEIPIEENGKKTIAMINCETLTIDGLSGHSDYKQLINYLGRLKQKPERVIFNHGEASACMEIARAVYNIYGIETLAPKLLETIRLK